VKGKYKRAKAWCLSCDRAMVAIGAKCPRCGKRFLKSKLRPPAAPEVKG
jgi:tRNA(Ile2) C34 agmatinyltransferase TiaS